MFYMYMGVVIKDMLTNGYMHVQYMYYTVYIVSIYTVFLY